MTLFNIVRSFITETFIDEADEAIVKAIIFLVGNLRSQVIAESVQTFESQDFLQRCGCGQVQGYLYGKSMPVGELKDFIQ